jgi:hydrogenase nickel incorporation protein HypA/HybF
MHELSIALSIVDAVLEEAERHGGARVQATHLRLGRLSGVDKDALAFSYRVACEETALQDSQLVIEEVEVIIHCPQCRGERAASSYPLLVCGDCGASGDAVVRGEELEIIGLEMAA